MRLTHSPSSCAECHEIWDPKSPGTLWATPGLLRDSFTYVYQEPILVAARFKARSEPVRLLGQRVRIPPLAWILVSSNCCVSSGREVSATALSHVQKSPTECCVSEFDIETSSMRISRL